MTASPKVQQTISKHKETFAEPWLGQNLSVSNEK